MEKKTSNVTYVIRLTFILVFFAVLCFPLALMALDGPDQTALESEAATEVEELSFETWKEGQFQSKFESWFSAHYPLRSDIVTMYKHFQYGIENLKPVVAVMDLISTKPTTPPTPSDPTKPDDGKTPSGSTPDDSGDDTPSNPDDDPGVTEDPMAIYTDPSNIYAEINKLQMAEVPQEPSGFKGSDRVYIGKSGYLFESAYIDEYMGYSAPYNTATREGIAETVDRLEYIQTELAKRGITMLYVLSSSKASQYSDFIPEYYKNRNYSPEGYVRPVDMLREELAGSTLKYLDSSEYYKQIGLLVTFPKTGIHWNKLASFESAAELLRMYKTLSGNENVKQLAVKGIISQTSPFGFGNSEVDVYNILYGQLGNVPGKIVDDAYYAPDVDVINPTAPAINILIQGGSFTHDFVHYLGGAYGVGNVRQIYYNGQHGTGQFSSGANPWTDGPMAWEKLLNGIDLLILEQTEQQIRSEHCTGNDWAGEYVRGEIGSNAVYDSLYTYLKATEK